MISFHPGVFGENEENDAERSTHQDTTLIDPNFRF